MRGVVWSRPGRRQKQEVGAGGCARRTQLLLLLEEEEDDIGVAVVGWASWLGCQVGCAAVGPGKLQVSSLSLFYFLFSIFL